MVGWLAGGTEKLGIEPATAQLELGLGLSLAILEIIKIDNKNGCDIVVT